MSPFGRPQTFAKSSPSIYPVTPARITTRAITNAYQTTISDGVHCWTYRPLRGRWVDEAGLTCDGLMAMVAARTGRPVEAPKGLREIAEQLDMPLDYIRGFLGGWENYSCTTYRHASALIVMGWSDGREAAKAMGLREPEREGESCLGR